MPQNGLPEISERDLIEAAEDLIALKETNGWKTLMVRLETEAANATEALIYVDAADVKEIESLQREVKRLNWFKGTIEELIQDGLGKEELELEPPEDA